MGKFNDWMSYRAILLESKQDIVNLGFPEIIAKLLYNKFGNLSFLIAKWYRDYKYSVDPKPENWWLQTTSRLQGRSLYDLTDLYRYTDTEENYKRGLYKKGISSDNFIDLEYDRKELEKQLEQEFFAEYFFSNPFIKKVISGEVSDLAPYKKLNFTDARTKFDKKNIFKDRTPLKVYPNGYKWIDVGAQCHLIADLMKNCGSALLMSGDKDRTMLVLFDSKNKPHIVATYSPNEKRINAVQGGASTPPKEMYHNYILDLTKLLNVRYDFTNSNSLTLKTRYLVSQMTDNFEKLPLEHDWYAYFRFNLDNNTYYTNGYHVVSAEDIQRVEDALQNKTLELPLKLGTTLEKTMNQVNRRALENLGIQFKDLEKISNDMGINKI
jgi:hypothetical protein